jgi:hypothetical protein
LEWPVPGRFDATKSARKNVSRFCPRNPLKSLDSDEIVRDLRIINDLPGR